MASVVEKWKIEKLENFEEYKKAIGVGDDKRADAHKYLSDGSGMTQEFPADGDTWTTTSSTVMGAKSLTFKLGEAIDSITLDGRKVPFSVEGDKLVEKQSRDGFECQHVRQGSGNTLTMELENPEKNVLGLMTTSQSHLKTRWNS